MNRQIVVILFILSGQLTFTFGQTYCAKAKLKAQTDFKKGNYFFHSLAFLPTENTYLFVLRKYYTIQWRFIDQNSLNYYNCYDSIMTICLKEKYGTDFINKANRKADSLEKTVNWIKKPTFPGGDSAMFKFISDRLMIEQGDLGAKIQTKIIVQVIINEKGKIKDIRILTKISKKIDRQVVRIFKEMPKWEPAYL